MDQQVLTIAPWDKRGLIGSPGYTMPDLGELVEYGLTDLRAGAVPNLLIAGAGGDDSARVWVHPQAKLRSKLQLTLGAGAAGCRIIIGPNCTITGQIICNRPNQTAILAGGPVSVGHSGQITARLWSEGNLLYVGHGSSSNGTAIEISGPGRAVIIGDDCMFAARVRIATADLHGLMDIATGTWRNPPADVVLEPHVWLADDVTVTKGVVMGLGSVAGAKSLVARSVPRSTAVGGVPAKPIARDVCWDRAFEPSPATVKRVEEMKARVAEFRADTL